MGMRLWLRREEWRRVSPYWAKIIATGGVKPEWVDRPPPPADYRTGAISREMRPHAEEWRDKALKMGMLERIPWKRAHTIHSIFLREKSTKGKYVSATVIYK